VLLPAVRNAKSDEIVIADGFSCREQIRQNTDRYPLHTAEVLKMVIKNELPKAGRPEESVTKHIKSEARAGKAKAFAVTVAVLGTAALGLWTIFGNKNKA
jgi:hypothetical protein